MKKRVNRNIMIEFIMNNLNRECGYSLSFAQTERMLSVIQECIESMVNEHYSFKLFDLNFNVEEKKGRLFRNLHTKNIEYAPPYLKLKINPNSDFQEKLKKSSQHYTEELPLKAGLSDTEYENALIDWKENFL